MSYNSNITLVKEGKVVIAICEYRIRLNLTQAQLAKIVGVTPNAITQYESGARNPNIIMLKKLAKALNTTTDSLLEPINIKEEK